MCIPAGLCNMNHLAINYSMKLLVLLLLISQFNITQVELVPIEVSSSGELKPVEPTEYRVLAEGNGNYARRRLAPFQLCLLCKCCTASSTNCATMPCCFGINCQLPNKPFGVCAFVPTTCNCTSCAV